MCWLCPIITVPISVSLFLKGTAAARQPSYPRTLRWLCSEGSTANCQSALSPGSAQLHPHLSKDFGSNTSPHSLFLTRVITITPLLCVCVVCCVMCVYVCVVYVCCVCVCCVCVCVVWVCYMCLCVVCVVYVCVVYVCVVCMHVCVCVCVCVCMSLCTSSCIWTRRYLGIYVPACGEQRLICGVIFCSSLIYLLSLCWTHSSLI